MKWLNVSNEGALIFSDLDVFTNFTKQKQRFESNQWQRYAVFKYFLLVHKTVFDILFWKRTKSVSFSEVIDRNVFFFVH